MITKINKRILSQFKLLFIIIILTGCAVGPNYVKPTVALPTKFKEAPSGWKIAQPQEHYNPGGWWEIFNDQQLNSLEQKVLVANQSIALALAQYQQARALVSEATAAYFPTLTSAMSKTRQRQNSSGSASVISSALLTRYLFSLDASWEPDIWGQVRRNVESNVAGAQASAAALAGAKLSMQASLAQYYFQLRNYDADQLMLDHIVDDNQKLLALTVKRFNAGVASRSDIIHAETQLKLSQAQAIDNKIFRAQVEHAIAILVGEAPANFYLNVNPKLIKPVTIPLQIPSSLLERRTDVIQAERQMAQANAQIGIAIAGYFPDITLTTSGGLRSGLFKRWLMLPARIWSVGPQLAATLFDAGLRNANMVQARAIYDQKVATYRQTVLSAFQDVEDSLVSVRILREENTVQQQALQNAKLSLKLVLNNYRAGTAAYSDVILAQNLAYNAEIDAADVAGRLLVSTVRLIKALGGNFS